MNVFNLVLLILALACFLVAALAGYAAGPPDGRPAGWVRTNFVALGLALWVLTIILAAVIR